MRSRIILFAAILSLFFHPALSYAQEGSEGLLIRQAQEDRKAIVAVEAYLNEDILEVKVTAIMKGTRPTIENVKFTGRKTGTLVPITIKQLYAELEKEPPYEIVRKNGLIPSGAKRVGELKGNRTRKLFTFKVPIEKVVTDGNYKLKIRVSAVKQTAGAKGKATKFTFHLDNLPNMILN